MRGSRWVPPLSLKMIKKKLLIAGWQKCDSQRIRRINALITHKFDYLAAAKMLRQMAAMSTDQETKHKARADANYLFAKYRILSNES